MNYHLNRDGNEVGVFTLDQLREGYSNGRFLPTDLVWREGMPEWVSLSELPDLGATEPGTTPGEAVLVASSTSFTEQRTGPAWENPASGNAVERAWTTIREAATAPQEFFRALRLEGGLTQPLIFYAGLAYIAVLVSSLLEAPIRLAMGGGMGDAVFGLVWAIFLGPLLLPLGAFVSAGMTHLCLMMLGGANKPFEATFRVVCYGYGAVAPAQAVPFFGVWVASVWGLVLEILGISAAHGISGGKATAAVLLPLAICCGIGAGMFFLVAASIGAEMFEF